jgi:hypothetical protein
MKFTQKQDLILHVRENHLKDKQNCPVCNDIFSTNFNLERHFLIIHCDAERFYCENCNKDFGRKYDLKAHAKRCGKDPGVIYKCKICGKGFLKKSNCKRHESNHSIQSDNVQPDTNMDEPIHVSSHRSDDDNNHDKRKPSKGKTFQCKKCGQKFKGASLFDTHKAQCKMEASNSQPIPMQQILSNEDEIPQKKIKQTKKVKCRRCGSEVDDYKQLYRHKLKVYIYVF